jgi:hypothetical protein
MTDRKRGERGSRELVPAQAAVREREPEREPEVDYGDASPFGHAYAVTTPTRSRLKGWMWIPLSFVFLLVGVALGFQAALTMGARPTLGGAPDLGLSLTVSKNDEDLTVKWNRDSAAIRGAEKGLLEIQDGKFTKPVELDAVHLQTGSIIYHNTSKEVQFRLTVYENARLTVVEMLDWKQ